MTRGRQAQQVRFTTNVELYCIQDAKAPTPHTSNRAVFWKTRPSRVFWLSFKPAPVPASLVRVIICVHPAPYPGRGAYALPRTGYHTGRQNIYNQSPQMLTVSLDSAVRRMLPQTMGKSSGTRSYKCNIWVESQDTVEHPDHPLPQCLPLSTPRRLYRSRNVLRIKTRKNFGCQNGHSEGPLNSDGIEGIL